MVEQNLYSLEELAKDTEMLEKHGHLTGEWDNVKRHCITQKIAAVVLSKWLSLDEVQSKKIIDVALIHDIEIRLQKDRKDFTIQDRADLLTNLDAVSEDPSLTRASGATFLNKFFQQGDGKGSTTTFLERLKFYLDDLTLEDEIVSTATRISATELRHPELNNDPMLTQKSGGRYWDQERKLCGIIEQEIYQRLIINGIDIDSPINISTMLSNEVNAIKKNLGITVDKTKK